MNLADNISYSLHDLEDALSLGMITKADWEQHFKDKEDLFENVAGGRQDLQFDAIKSALFGLSHDRKCAIGGLVNLMITSTKISENDSGCDSPLLNLKVELDSDVEKLRSEIFDVVMKKVILNENVQQLEFKGQKIVIELFQVLASDPERFLPKPTLHRWEEAAKDCEDEDKERVQIRVICDFVSGMTDGYAAKFYEKIFSPSKGSIFDKL